MRIAVIGTGGVGGYFGGRLAAAGEDVVFLARGKHLDAMRQDGLRVESIKGDFAVPQIQATDDLNAMGTADIVLLAVKSWQVADMADRLKPCLKDHSLVIPLQNGVEAPDQLTERLGANHAVGGMCRIVSFVAGPGLIRHVAAEPDIFFGNLEGHAAPLLDDLQARFTKAGVVAEHTQRIREVMWEKFLFISAIGGVGSVTRVPAGVFRTVPESRQLLEQAMAEVAATARALGISLADDIVSRSMSYIDALPAEAMSSMQREMAEGRPTELMEWNGAVVRLARKAGVAAPVQNVIFASLLPLERQHRGL